MIYKGSFLYPPRPENAIPPALLPFYEDRGFVAQLKKNGTGNIMAVSPDRRLKCWTRHGTPHEQWNPSDFNADAFRHLPGGWYVFCAELIHSKVRGIRQVNYVNDILVADSRYLTGTTFAERQTMLQAMFEGEQKYGYKLIDPYTWVATSFTEKFGKHFKKVAERKAAEDEGFVLKRPDAKLAFPSRPGSNSGWQVKCRLESNSYIF